MIRIGSLEDGKWSLNLQIINEFGFIFQGKRVPLASFHFRDYTEERTLLAS